MPIAASSGGVQEQNMNKASDFCQKFSSRIFDQTVPAVGLVQRFVRVGRLQLHANKTGEYHAS